MVRAKGLEPPHLAILVPKTSASTNSATPAGAVGRVHDVTDCRARPCGPRGAIADASPRARAERRESQRTERTPRPFVDTARRQSMATNPDPLPKPKPDTIEPQAPHDEPDQPAPVDNHDSQPQDRKSGV